MCLCGVQRTNSGSGFSSSPWVVRLTWQAFYPLGGFTTQGCVSFWCLADWAHNVSIYSLFPLSSLPLLLLLGQVGEVTEDMQNGYSQTFSTIPLNSLTPCSVNFNLLMKMQDMTRGQFLQLCISFVEKCSSSSGMFHSEL